MRVCFHLICYKIGKKYGGWQNKSKFSALCFIQWPLKFTVPIAPGNLINSTPGQAARNPLLHDTFPSLWAAIRLFQLLFLIFMIHFITCWDSKAGIELHRVCLCRIYYKKNFLERRADHTKAVSSHINRGIELKGDYLHLGCSHVIWPTSSLPTRS